MPNRILPGGQPFLPSPLQKSNLMPLITISNIALSGKIQNHEFRKEDIRTVIATSRYGIGEPGVILQLNSIMKESLAPGYYRITEAGRDT